MESDGKVGQRPELRNWERPLPLQKLGSGGVGPEIC